ncbi:MAG: hypothetical protein FWC11_04270 [Firmicutes bacterium]|nr:hypothetical protein [Bacillota bacterium]
MRKFLIMFLLFVAVATSMVFAVGFSPDKDYFVELENGETLSERVLFDNVEKSMAMFDSVMTRYRRPSLIQPFSFDGVPQYDYNSQFAGVWYCERGYLNIGVTNDSREATRSPAVVYHLRDFSHNFLMTVHGAIWERSPHYSIFGVALLPQYNQVEVRLENKNYIANIITYLETRSLFRENSIKFIEEEMPTPTNMHSPMNDWSYRPSHVEEEDEIVGPMSSNPTPNPIHAGGRIFASSINASNQNWRPWRGTISATATCNITGRPGIITNAHVAESFNRNFSTRDDLEDRNGNTIIANQRAQYIMIGLADATFIPFANPHAWEFNSSASWFTRGSPIPDG